MTSIGKFYSDSDGDLFMCIDITKECVIIKSKEMDEDGDFTFRKVPITTFSKQYKEVSETRFPKKEINLFKVESSFDFFNYLCYNSRKKIDKSYNHSVKEGLFFYKNDRLSKQQILDVHDFYKRSVPIENFKDFPDEANVILYRFIRPHTQFKKDQEIVQMLPMSTSIEPEFQAYVWSGKDDCCILQIHIKGKYYKKSNYICILEQLDKKLLLEKILENKKNDYQSEILLGPGIMKVRDIKTLIIPSKEKYRQEMMKNPEYFNYLDNLMSDDKDDYQEVKKIMISVEYRPFTLDQFNAYTQS